MLQKKLFELIECRKKKIQSKRRFFLTKSIFKLFQAFQMSWSETFASQSCGMASSHELELKNCETVFLDLDCLMSFFYLKKQYKISELRLFTIFLDLIFTHFFNDN